MVPATRVAEQRESAKLRDDQEAKKKENVDKLFAGDGGGRKAKPRRDGFPDLPDDVASVRQCNEGDFEFLLTEDAGEDGDAVELEIKVGKFVDSSLMDVDVQPRVARALVKGRMLCLTLPVEVLPDASTAQRSKVTGSLVVHMPKARTRKRTRRRGARTTSSGRGDPRAARAGRSPPPTPGGRRAGRGARTSMRGGEGSRSERAEVRARSVATSFATSAASRCRAAR